MVEMMVRITIDVTFLTILNMSQAVSVLFTKDQEHIHGDDTPKSAPIENPIKLAFSRANMRPLLSSIMVPLLWSSGFYLTFVWMAVFMSDLIDPPIPNSFLVNSASLFFSVCLIFPLAGILSDKFGRKRVMGLGGLLLAILSPVLILIISRGSMASAFLSQFIMGVGLCLWGAPMMAWLAESFEPAARLTSVSIGYNIAQALGGGMAPAIATELVDRVGSTSPGYYLTIIASTALVGLCCVAPRSPVHFSVLNSEDDIVENGSPQEIKNRIASTTDDCDWDVQSENENDLI
jgi:MFS family permease